MSSAEQHLAVGDAHLAAGDLGQAIEAFRAAVAADPASVVAKVRLGDAYVKAADRAATPEDERARLLWAEGTILDAVEMDFTDTEARRLARLVGARLHAAGDEEDAETGPLFRAATGAYCAGKLDEAKRGYEAILAVRPDQPAALKYLGNCHIGMKQYVEAEAWFRRSLERRPLDAQGWFFLADTLLTLRRREEGLDALVSAIAAHPCYWTAWLRLSTELGHTAVPRGLKTFRLVPCGRISADPAVGLIISPDPGTPEHVAEAWRAFTRGVTSALSTGSSFQQQRAGLAAMAAHMEGAPPGTRPWALWFLPFVVRMGHLDAVTFLLFFRDSMRDEHEAWKGTPAAGPPARVKDFILQARLGPL
jgi:tetratricopeptide (TPR) repeat protein